MPLSGEITIEPLGNYAKPKIENLPLDEVWKFYEENGEAGKVVVNNLLRAMYNEIIALREQVKAMKAKPSATAKETTSDEPKAKKQK